MKRFSDLLARFSKKGIKPEIGPIGIEFAREAIHMVQLHKEVDGSFHLMARASANYPLALEEFLNSPNEIKRLVSRMLKQDHFYSNKVVSSLPPGCARLLPITYQKSDSQDEQQELVKALYNRLGGNLDDYVIDFLPVRRSAENESGLAIAAVAKQEDVVRYLDNLRHCKLDVSTLDINPIAIKRLVCAMSKPGFIDNVLIINFGSLKSYFTMLSGRRMIFDHEVDFGENRLLTKIASELDVSVAEAGDLVREYCISSACIQEAGETIFSAEDVFHTIAEIIKPLFIELAAEITRALIYIASETRGESPDKIFLVGSIARWKEVDSILNSLLDISVRSIPDPLRRFPRSNRDGLVDDGEALPEIAVATGLALRGLYSDE